MTTVMLVDDHALVRQALAALIEAAEDLTLVAAAVDGQHALELAPVARPDVVLMDLSMPRLDGVEATRQLVAMLPGIQVVILSSSENNRLINQALAAGAVSYLRKGSDPGCVLCAVRAAAAGASDKALGADHSTSS
jgi:DNA-binding NarL/FixJ family response regulator